MRSKLGALLWLLVLSGIGLWLASRLAGGPVLNADLMDLLPAPVHHQSVEEAADRFLARAERRLVFVISAPQGRDAKAAADYVLGQLETSGQFDELELKRDSDALRAFATFYFPHRFALLSTEARRDLLASDEAAFERHLLTRYFSPVEALSSSLIEADPLLLLTDYLGQLGRQAGSRLQLDDGYLSIEAEGRFHILLIGQLAESPFSLQVQDRLNPTLRDLRAAVPQRFGGADVIMAGVFPHAAAGTESARREVSRVGLGSLLGILVLFVVAFRSLTPFAMSFLSIAVGCLSGFAICLAVFGQVHLLTLVFGASLVGISVDYSLHYFCEAFRTAEAWSPSAALRRVFPGITLGLVPSVIGIAGLLVTPFPGMQEMAVFSSVGLIAAYLTVVTFYPLVKSRMAAPGALLPRAAAAYRRLWEGGLGKRGWMVLLLLIPAGAGCLLLAPLDDFRLLQARDRQVQAEEDRIKALSGQDYAGQFILVAGRDENELLEREESLAEALAVLKRDGKVGDFVGLSSLVPSPRRQIENRSLIEPLLRADSPVFQRLAETVGLPDAARQTYLEAFKESAGQPPLALADWLASPVSASFRHLWLGTAGDGVIGALVLQGVTDQTAVERLVKEHQGVTFVDRAGDLSRLFSDYRGRTLWLTAVSYIFVTLLLLLRYGLRGALGVMAVPLGAAIACFGTLGFLGESISLFNVMALLLILGIGVDYGIFFREAGGGSTPTLLAVAMSSLTTLLAFGLLAVSSTAAVHAFGITLLLGISAAFLLSPLAAVAFPAAHPQHSTGDLP
ncbi:MAG: MMPL family transporter [Kiloniellaceae bacterium]